MKSLKFLKSGSLLSQLKESAFFNECESIFADNNFYHGFKCSIVSMPAEYAEAGGVLLFFDICVSVLKGKEFPLSNIYPAYGDFISEAVYSFSGNESDPFNFALITVSSFFHLIRNIPLVSDFYYELPDSYDLVFKKFKNCNIIPSNFYPVIENVFNSNAKISSFLPVKMASSDKSLIESYSIIHDRTAFINKLPVIDPEISLSDIPLKVKKDKIKRGEIDGIRNIRNFNELSKLKPSEYAYFEDKNIFSYKIATNSFITYDLLGNPEFGKKSSINFLYDFCFDKDEFFIQSDDDIVSVFSFMKVISSYILFSFYDLRLSEKGDFINKCTDITYNFFNDGCISSSIKDKVIFEKLSSDIDWSYDYLRTYFNMYNPDFFSFNPLRVSGVDNYYQKIAQEIKVKDNSVTVILSRKNNDEIKPLLSRMHNAIIKKTGSDKHGLFALSFSELPVLNDECMRFINENMLKISVYSDFYRNTIMNIDDAVSAATNLLFKYTAE